LNAVAIDHIKEERAIHLFLEKTLVKLKKRISQKTNKQTKNPTQ
jgi:ABC-type metal ion transport system substrate-binding protein